MAELIGPYQILGELGRGAMAVVWRAHDTRLEREVAIKEPVVPQGTDPATAAELSARFVREGKAAAKLNHPGIVTIHAADIYDGRPAIVMELIEGETLGEIINRGPLPAPAALSIIDQLLDAVGFAHARGVVHRDIKPDNIFVTPDGRVKLTDFGIAHVGTTAALTQAGTIMGTPGYMAPEQVTGQPVDARADLFAIGVIAYEMLTGQNPFGATSGEAPTTIMYRIVHEAAPALPAHALAGLAFDVAGVLSVALAKDPANRFADATAFRNALAGGPIVTAGALDPAGTPTVFANPQAAAATVVHQQQSSSARPTWLPYALVGGAGVLVIGALLIASGGTPAGSAGAGAGTSSAAQPDATEVPAETEVPAAVPASGDSGPSEGELTYHARAYASSELASSGSSTYNEYNLLDGDPDTCWAEGVKGYGGGQSVTFEFDEPVYLTQIGSIVGYDKNMDGWDRWITNGRLKVAEFEYSDGTRERHTFTDSRGMQWYRLSEPKKTDYVIMRIVAAYEAQRASGHGPADDTSISEFGFRGWTAAAAGE